MLRRIIIRIKQLFNRSLTENEFRLFAESALPPDETAHLEGEKTDPSVYDDPFDGEAVEVPIEDHIDLHTFAPNETRQAVEAYLEAAAEEGLRRVRIITGRGRGIQRRIIRSLLENHPGVMRFEDATPEEGGWGATIVYLGGDDGRTE